MVFLVLVGLATLAGIMYLAVSRQSSFKIRIAALVALALMIMTIIICLVLFFKSAATPKVILLPDMSPSDLPPVSTQHNIPMLVMLIIFLIALFVMIAVLAMREAKRTSGHDDAEDNSLKNDW